MIAAAGEERRDRVRRQAAQKFVLAQARSGADEFIATVLQKLVRLRAEEFAAKEANPDFKI